MILITKLTDTIGDTFTALPCAEESIVTLSTLIILGMSCAKTLDILLTILSDSDLFPVVTDTVII